MHLGASITSKKRRELEFWHTAYMLWSEKILEIKKIKEAQPATNVMMPR